MSKKTKEMNLYYMKQGQASKEDIEDIMKRKKAKEREKRIKQNKIKREDNFDIETETVIQMTNKNKLRKEEERIKKINQQEKKRKKRNKKIKMFLKIFLLLGIIIGGTVFAMVSPIFNIKEVQVVNQKQISAETIISLSELKTGENIFRFNSNKVINKIKENAYVEKATIHRKIPNVVQIDVQEREHSYSVDFLGKYAYINNQGYILEIGEDSKQKTILQGISTPEDQVTVGNRLNEEDLKKLEDVLKILKVAKEYNLDTKVTSIDISDQNEYSIYLEEEKKKVHLGNNEHLSNKMLYVESVIQEEKGKPGEIFVNVKTDSKYQGYFRESLNV